MYHQIQNIIWHQQQTFNSHSIRHHITDITNKTLDSTGPKRLPWGTPVDRYFITVIVELYLQHDAVARIH